MIMGASKGDKIRVMLAITDLSIGGIELVNLNLAKYLDKSKFAVTLVCWRGEGRLVDKLKEMDFNLEVFGLPAWAFIVIFIRFLLEIKRKKIDILHGNPGSYARLAGKLMNAPVIISSFHSQWQLGFGKALLDRIHSKYNDHFIAVSKSVREHIKHQQKLRDDNITVIYNGISIEPSYRDRNSAKLRRELGLSLTTPLVGFAGRLDYDKGVDILLQASKEILKKNHQVNIIIIGDGVERRNLERLASNLGISSQVHFTGFRDDIPHILSTINIFVAPARRAGFELTLTEAMASGVPIVATKCGAIPEVVADGETGILVPPEDPQAIAEAVIYLLKNPRLRKKMGSAGRKRVKEMFTVERMVAQYEELYERLLAEKTGRKSIKKR